MRTQQPTRIRTLTMSHRQRSFGTPDCPQVGTVPRRNSDEKWPEAPRGQPICQPAGSSTKPSHREVKVDVQAGRLHLLGQQKFPGAASIEGHIHNALVIGRNFDSLLIQDARPPPRPWWAESGERFIDGGISAQLAHTG